MRLTPGWFGCWLHRVTMNSDKAAMKTYWRERLAATPLAPLPDEHLAKVMAVLGADTPVLHAPAQEAA